MQSNKQKVSRGASLDGDHFFVSVHPLTLRLSDFFLWDSTGFFKRRHTMFKTYVTHPTVGTTECLVYPIGNDHLGIVYPRDVMWASHQIRVNGELQEARMSIVVKSDEKRGRVFG